ncbi:MULTISPECIES: hypothetical protein [Thermomonospora]|uniref:Uncharacterized protein n=1 Tax=Thermomonospora cellulosilytica TaxID=1411118 RepID=A0A7W3N4W2_9ACTN|nr:MULTISPECIES: hypothetical protein [Thermomonospora]MBA9007522.1 hypothetical protein [Thermomonospora cellulosilytica]
MISMMRKSATWTAPCPGLAGLAPQLPALTLLAQPEQDCGRNGGDRPFTRTASMHRGLARLREVRHLQPYQDERQGWSVFSGTATGSIVRTATQGGVQRIVRTVSGLDEAHVAANGGMSGPYPWRRPV